MENPKVGDLVSPKQDHYLNNDTRSDIIFKKSKSYRLHDAGDKFYTLDETGIKHYLSRGFLIEKFKSAKERRNKLLNELLNE